MSKEPMFNIAERAPVWLAGIFIAVQAFVAFAPNGLVNALASPGVLLPWGQGGRSASEQLISLFGHGFLHSGWTHALVNAGMTVAFGVITIRGIKLRALSRGRPSSGEGQFLLIFIIGVIAGGLAQWAQWAFVGATQAAAVGASGGGSALFATAAWAMGGRSQLLRFGFGWVFINMIFVIFEETLGIRMAWAAHLGGYAAGAILAPLFVRANSTGFDVTR